MSKSNEVMDQSRGAVDQLKEKAAEVTQNIRDMGGTVRDTAKEQYDHLRDRANDYYDQGRNKARQWEDSIEGYVHDKPVKALLIAAGVGLVLGMISRRR